MAVNRRDFIKDAGIVGAVALSGLSVAQCASTQKKLAKKPTAKRVNEPT